MKKLILNILAIAFAVLSLNSVNAQTINDVNFFHLGDYVPQTQSLSPVFIPKNSFTLGLPGISGVDFTFRNSDFAAEDIFTESTNNQGQRQLDYDWAKMFATIEGDYNNISLNTKVSVLQLAFKRQKGSLSFFINNVNNIDWQMSRGLLSLLAFGVDEGFTLNDRLNSTSYAELGVGFTQQFLEKKLAVGIRLKYISGIANTSLEEDGFADLKIEDDNSWTINTQNAVARSSGYDNENEEFGFGGNIGFGVDLGVSYEIIPNLVVEAAINDIGSIKWENNVTEYYLENKTDVKISAEDNDLKASGDILENLLDVIEDKVSHGERAGNSYTTNLATNSMLSASYKLGDINTFRLSMFNNHEKDDAKPIFAAGYNLTTKKTSIGVNGIMSDGNFDVGLNMALGLGPIQLYLATAGLNNLEGGKVEKLKQMNFRFGINIAVGYNKWLDDEDEE